MGEGIGAGPGLWRRDRTGGTDRSGL